MTRARRSTFGMAAVVAALLLAVAPAAAADPSTMVFIHGAGVNDVTFSHITVGQYLGYYEKGGIALQVEAVSGSGASVQAVAVGKAHAASTTHALLLLPASKGTDLDLVTVYTYLPRHYYGVVVKPGSPISDLRQLAGKRIGIPNMAASPLPYTKAMLKEVGVDPESVSFAAVGFGVPPAKALYDGAVDALSIFDVSYAAMENEGFTLKYLPLPKEFDRLSGNGVSVKREFLKTHRRQIVGLLRGMAESSLFALKNPEAALRIHWKLYPETRPKGVSEDEAFRKAFHIQAARLSRVSPEGRPVPKWGYIAAADWARTVEIFGLQGRVGDLQRFYTNDLIDEVNTFDPKRIERDARTFTLKEGERR